jgi:hypothetical protein
MTICLWSIPHIIRQRWGETGKTNWYFFANKNACFVSVVPKVVPQKIKNKTGQTLGFGAFSGNEGMGGQRMSNTQKMHNALYFLLKQRWVILLK